MPLCFQGIEGDLNVPFGISSVVSKSVTYLVCKCCCGMCQCLRHGFVSDINRGPNEP